MNPTRSFVLAAAAASLAGCAAAPRPAEIRWEPIVVFEGDAAFETVKTGRPDASDPHLQIAGVDQAGKLVLVRFDAGVAPRAAVLYDNRSEMTGLRIADADPQVRGEEIYVGAYEPGQEGVGGCVLQVVVTPGGADVRRIFTAGSYVHAIELLPPAAPGGANRLVATTYAGEIVVLTPRGGTGEWESRFVYRNPPIADLVTKDPRPRIKDVVALRDPAGRPAHEVLAVFAGGRAVYVDVDAPDTAKIVAEEEGGWGRVCADEGTGAYACGYRGRIVRFTRDAQNAFAMSVLEQEGVDSGLRGMVMGRFPLPGGGGEFASLATHGFYAHCRLLYPRASAWDPVTLFTDVGRGHSLAAGDLVPGNDADELVLGGYSKRITVLVPRVSRP